MTSNKSLRRVVVRSGLGKRVFGAVGGLLIIIGMMSTCLTIYLHIREGRGAEPVQNYLGQIGTSASSAAGIIAGSLMLLAGSLTAAWQRWRRRVGTETHERGKSTVPAPRLRS